MLSPPPELDELLELELEETAPEELLELVTTPDELEEDPPSEPEDEDDPIWLPELDEVEPDEAVPELEEPPLLHPCNARAPVAIRIKARFFKVKSPVLSLYF